MTVGKYKRIQEMKDARAGLEKAEARFNEADKAVSEADKAGGGDAYNRAMREYSKAESALVAARNRDVVARR